MSILQITESSLRKAACKLNKPRARYEFFCTDQLQTKNGFLGMLDGYNRQYLKEWWHKRKFVLLLVIN
jgi:hypothetical protein